MLKCGKTTHEHRNRNQVLQEETLKLESGCKIHVVREGDVIGGKHLEED